MYFIIDNCLLSDTNICAKSLNENAQLFLRLIGTMHARGTMVTFQ